jgi:disulfide bond formation protein DsbB
MKSKMIYLSWLLSVIATLGSLYFSNIMMLPPCSLCWWQRICMYPLSLIFVIAFLRKDANCLYYSTPLVVIGFLISSYHNLLYYGFIEKSFIPCTAGVSCTSIQLEWLGFITIPLMALTSFSILLIISIYSLINKKDNP